MTPRITAGLRTAVRHSPVFPILKRRRFQVYSLGGPKTGTTSVARLFENGFRSAHEPLHAGTISHVLRALKNELSHDELVRYLRWRDRELYLELESSHLTAVFVERLVELFPRARFILTVREPLSWLDSMINQQLNGRLQRERSATPGPRAAFFPALHDIVCKKGLFPFGPEERVLEEQGLYPLAGYLSWWADHIRIVAESVPAERLLVLRTERLSSEVDRIADFVGVCADRLNTANQHSNQAPARHDLMRQIDPAFVASRIEHHCSSVNALLAPHLNCSW